MTNYKYQVVISGLSKYTGCISRFYFYKVTTRGYIMFEN